MDFNRAFRYILDDKDWLSKIGLGLVIMIVPVLNFAWTGYLVQIIRNVRDNETIVLPTWDNLGKKFMDGLMLVLAGLIYALPILLVACLPLAIIVIPAVISQGQGSLNALMTGSMVVTSCLLCLGVLYGLALSIFMPVVQIFYAREGTFASCFKIREIFQTITRHAGPFFTIWLVSLGVSLGVGLATGIVGGILGWIPLLGQLLVFVLGVAGSAYVLYFSSHLYGQFAAQVSGSEDSM
jgi:hypothetical protein